MEYIAGPIHGFYLACYTVPSYDGHFAYAKVCAVCPQSVWEQGIATRKIGAGPFATENEALEAVQAEARRRLAARAAHVEVLMGAADARSPAAACR